MRKGRNNPKDSHTDPKCSSSGADENGIFEHHDEIMSCARIRWLGGSFRPTNQRARPALSSIAFLMSARLKSVASRLAIHLRLGIVIALHLLVLCSVVGVWRW